MDKSRELMKVYLGPRGLPLHHCGFPSGDLTEAIHAYINHGANWLMAEKPTSDELGLVIDYCAYFINAPCWKGPADQLTLLREQIERVSTIDELNTWLMASVRIGIDPL